jgi:uncharacterized protein YjbI with pentapeptide repeats
MKQSYHEQNFIDESFTISKTEFEACTFKNINFSDFDFSGAVFIDCEFTQCNLSNIKLQNCSFRGVHFIDCKMIGCMFDKCSKFGLSLGFMRCNLNNSSFFKCNVKKTTFEQCNLREIDFTESNLFDAKFLNCDLLLARFENTNIEKADLGSSINYNIDPTMNKINKAIVSFRSLDGFLQKYDLTFVR